MSAEQRRPAAAWPTAGTHAAGVIGDPIGHSLSPVIHNAAFSALGLDWVFLAFPVPKGDAGPALEGARALGVAGLSVTMPHKQDVARLLSRCSPTARALEAVNVVVRRGGELEGESTDGDGFLDSLRHDAGFDPAGRRCLVVGGGGAARAVVMALAGAGAARVIVTNRSPGRAERAAALAGRVGAVGSPADAEGVDLVVNATPVGMAGGGPPGVPIELSRLGAGQVVVDLVYNPVITELLRGATARGAVAVSGVGMLVHQAARAFSLWTGERAPLDAMRASADAALEAEGSAGGEDSLPDETLGDPATKL